MLLALLLATSPLLAQTPARTDWPRDLYNPSPRPDDVLLPLPCGGAMAFRWVQAEGQVFAGVEAALAPLFRLVGPFEREGRHDLLLGKYEVSRLQYETLPALTGGPCPRVDEAGRLVQGGVGWYDALGFAARWSRWLGQRAPSLPECARAATLCVPRVAGRDALVRLPTEAEWEYAARGGLAVTPAQFGQPLYPMADGLEHHAWYERNSDHQIKPIGQRAASPLGLHDLYGNVEELTLDLYRSALYPGQSGAAVIRGGSVYTPRGGLDAGQRRETPLYGHGGANRAPDNGFRLLAEVPAAPDSALVTAAALPAPGAAAAKVAAATGQIQVNVDTAAQVFIDGRIAGQAAPGVPLEARGLAVGEHWVELSAAGYQTVSERHGVAVGRWTQVAVTMQPLSAPETPLTALIGGWLTGRAIRAILIALVFLGLVWFMAIRTLTGRRGSDLRRQPVTVSEHRAPAPLVPPERSDRPRPASTAVDTTGPFDAKGRFTRLSWLAWNLVLAVIWSLAVLALAALGLVGPQAHANTAITLISLLILVVLGWRLTIRRFHDIGASGWWSMTLLLKIVNLITVLVLAFRRGDEGSNRFGPPRPTPNWERVLGIICIVLVVLGLIALIPSLA